MKHYVKRWLDRKHISYDTERQNNKESIIVKPADRDELVKFLNSKNLLSYEETRFNGDLIFLYLM